MRVLPRILAVLSVAVCTTNANVDMLHVHVKKHTGSRQAGLAFAGGFTPRQLLPAHSYGRSPAKRSFASSSRVLVPHVRKSRAVGTCMVGSMGGSMGDSRSWGSDPLGEGDAFSGSDDAWEGLGKVFVLLFNPRTDQEGICESSPALIHPIPLHETMQHRLISMRTIAAARECGHANSYGMICLQCDRGNDCLRTLQK